MSHSTATLFTILFLILTALICGSAALYLRRIWIARKRRLHALHVRLLRAELMQALARDETAFLIDHWTNRDRKAALEVAAQLLAFIKGNDREKLEAIVEANHIFNRPLLRINRTSKNKRIAAIRSLAAFGNRAVQGTLEHLMLNDPSAEVRLEAAIAVTVAGQLPAPWNVIRSVCQGITQPSPNHYRLFEQMMPDACDAMLAIARFQEDRTIRLLAIHALGLGEAEQVARVLQALSNDDDKEIAAMAAEALDRVSLAPKRTKKRERATVIYLADKRAA